jgi:hypothetical protein
LFDPIVICLVQVLGSAINCDAYQVKTEFRKATFEGAVLDPTPGGLGFRCEDGTKTHVCFGRTGEQVRYLCYVCCFQRRCRRRLVPPGLLFLSIK